jgi:hypothetical protein
MKERTLAVAKEYGLHNFEYCQTTSGSLFGSFNEHLASSVTNSQGRLKGHTLNCSIHNSPTCRPEWQRDEQCTTMINRGKSRLDRMNTPSDERHQ